MIELFARKPELIRLHDEAQLTPIAVEDDVVSLSAILLNDAYYEALQAAKRNVDGITVIDQTLLIPFKAHAFLDLTARVKAGEEIDSKNIKKHRNDVFRLVLLLPKDASVKISDAIRDDLQRFIDADEADGGVDMKALGVALTRGEALALLRSAYGLKVEQ
jgi:hypothetical protein